jgi:hypothetical protein
MRLRHHVSWFSFLAVPAIAAIWIGAPSCNAASFEPGNKVTGLRVLAVKKEPSYAAPGDTVKVTLLYWDGKVPVQGERNIDVQFLSCCNPLGDLYYNCFLQPTSCDGVVGALDGGAAPGDAGSDSDGGAAASPSASYAVSITEEAGAIVTRPGAQNNPSYGLVYFLFTACAGFLGQRTAATMNDLPVGCFEDVQRTKELGPDDFVPGYSALYVYPRQIDGGVTRQNANPKISDLLLSSNCTGADCSLLNGAEHRVPVCPTADCEVDLQVVVDPAEAEIDPSATGPNGEVLTEQMWVDFYSTRGDFTSPVRLLNDAVAGWNFDNATKFKVPAEPGPVHLWAVVHDSRGGVEWTEAEIIVGD